MSAKVPSQGDRCVKQQEISFMFGMCFLPRAAMHKVRDIPQRPEQVHCEYGRSAEPVALGDQFEKGEERIMNLK
jgi:hypothetical protein